MKNSETSTETRSGVFKWVALIAAAAAVVVGIISWVRFNTAEFERTAIDQTNQQLLNIARAESQHIQEFIQDIRADLAMLAENPFIREYNNERGTVEKAEEKPDYLPGEILYDHMRGRINSFYRTNDKGIVLARVPFKQGKTGADYSHKPGIKAVIENHRPYVSELFTTNSGKHGFSICHPVFEDEDFVGVVRVVVYLESLNDFVKQIEVGETGYIWILNQDARMLAGPQADDVGKDILAVKNSSHPDCNWSELQNVVKRMTDGEDGVGIFNSVHGASGHPDDRYETARRLTAYAPVNVGNGTWSVGVTMSYDEIAGPVKRNARNNLLAATVLLLAFGAGGVFLFRNQRKQAELQILARSAEELRAANEKLLLEVDQRKRAEEELKAQRRSLEDEIAERKRIDAALRESEEKYRTLFEESKDGVFISTPEGRFLDVNPAAVEMFGYDSREELLRIDIARDLYVDPAQREITKADLAKQEFIKDYELNYKRKDGKEVIVLETVTVIRGDDGKIVGYRGIMRDVTEQKQLEQQFLQAQKMESIGTLAGGIAHDFNNILSGILGYASLAKMRLSEDDPIYGYVETIEKSGMRAANLTAQLLGFARGGKYHPTSVHINDIVTETREIIASTFDKSIEIESFTDDALPTVEVDATQMQQVLMNLLVNAGDAMPSGGKITIETSVETLDEQYADNYSYVEPGAYVVLAVADTGMGMDKEILERVFEPFFTTKEEGKGTGLGLSMVYGVVKNHGGFLHVYSEPGEGTLFKVYLPVAAGTQAKSEALPGEEDGPSSYTGDELILVVDDEETIRLLAREILEGHGYRVLLAEDGVVGLETFRRENGNIDLVILDMAMPNLGGRETFLKMKALNPDVKAVLSTGFSENAKARQILRDGVIGFIQKPYRVNALLSKVRQALDAA